MMDEFDIIQHYFTKETLHRADVCLGIGDDCAIVRVPVDHELVITTDTLVAGVHFPINTAAFDIGFKALAVNLSDLAAMGATPAWITLALTLPEVNNIWLKEFSRGLFELAKRYSVQLIGGDLTRGSLSITIQAHGFIPQHQALRRDRAQLADFIYVTHTLGDAALALRFLKNEIELAAPIQEQLVKRLNQPEPRITIGEKLINIAHAAIDISDGLATDLTHILAKSELGAIVYVDHLPISDAVSQSVSAETAIQLALNGGDDYELCFTVPQEKIAMLDFDCTCIGKITSQLGLDLRYANGENYVGSTDGYQHFKD